MVTSVVLYLLHGTELSPFLGTRLSAGLFSLHQRSPPNPLPSQLTYFTVRPKHPLRCVPSEEHFPAISAQREQLKTFPPPLSWGMSAF